MCKSFLLVPFVLFLLPIVSEAGSAKLEGVINLNTATPEELRLLSGIGPTRIRNILAYRKEHPFRTVEELARIKGIGQKTVRRMRLHLAVSGPTTIQKVMRPVDTPVAPAAALQGAKKPETLPSIKIVKIPALTHSIKASPMKSKPSSGNDSRFLGFGNNCLPPP